MIGHQEEPEEKTTLSRKAEPRVKAGLGEHHRGEGQDGRWKDSQGKV